MPEETAPEETQDTPTDATEQSGPDDGTPAEESTDDSQTQTPDDGYEKRYSDLRSHNTRVEQENAQYRQFVEALSDPERRAEALAAFGLEYEDDEQDTFDEDEPWDERFERIEQVLQDQADRRAEDELAELEEKFYEAELKKLDPEDKFSDSYTDLLIGLADEYEDEEGLPDLAAAHKALQDEFESQRKSWIDSKRTPQAPSGASASHQPDLDDPEARRDYMQRRLADLAEAS